jgi:hypothetical protein
MKYEFSELIPKGQQRDLQGSHAGFYCEETTGLYGLDPNGSG